MLVHLGTPLVLPLRLGATELRAHKPQSQPQAAAAKAAKAAAVMVAATLNASGDDLIHNVGVAAAAATVAAAETMKHERDSVNNERIHFHNCYGMKEKNIPVQIREKMLHALFYLKFAIFLRVSTFKTGICA
jgi:hypothetical protein